MNLPNKLTLLRVILVPLFVFFIMADFVAFNFVYATLIFAIASYTDYLDGSIARKQGLVTDFGKFADPLADKIMVMSALICFVALGLTNVWYVILIMFREFAVTSIRLVAAGTGKVVAASNHGKVKTVTQIIAIIIVLVCGVFSDVFPLFVSDMAIFETVFYYLSEIGMGIATLATFVSGYLYIKENWDLIKQMK